MFSGGQCDLLLSANLGAVMLFGTVENGCCMKDRLVLASGWLTENKI